MTYDITGRIGPQFRPQDEPEWPMNSYERPAYMLWNAIASELHAAKWPEARIRDWLQSKQARWALDGDLGNRIRKAGRAHARDVVLSDPHHG